MTHIATGIICRTLTRSTSRLCGATLCVDPSSTRENRHALSGVHKTQTQTQTHQSRTLSSGYLGGGKRFQTKPLSHLCGVSQSKCSSTRRVGVKSPQKLDGRRCLSGWRHFSSNSDGPNTTSDGNSRGNDDEHDDDDDGDDYDDDDDDDEASYDDDGSIRESEKGGLNAGGDGQVWDGGIPSTTFGGSGTDAVDEFLKDLDLHTEAIGSEMQDLSELQPWTITESDVKDLDLYTELKKEVPTLTSFEDLLECKDVDTHLSLTPADADNLEHAQWSIHEVIQALLEEQGDNITLLQTDTTFRDYSSFCVLVSARSTRHLRTMGQRVLREMKARNLPIDRAQGRHDQFWMVVNTGYYAIHLMRPQAREYYDLEGLWAPEGSPLFKKEDF